MDRPGLVVGGVRLRVLEGKSGGYRKEELLKREGFW